MGAPKAMTAAHKEALAKGREEARVVRRYLEAVDARRLQELADLEAALARLDRADHAGDGMAELERGRGLGVRARTGRDQTGAGTPSSDRSRTAPSTSPVSSSQARSGWGIRPTTLRPSLQIPAMSSTEPFGLST
jgi:hypothetical protein